MITQRRQSASLFLYKRMRYNRAMDVLDWLKQTIKNKKRYHLKQDDVLSSRNDEKENLIREQRYLAEEIKRITDQYIEKHERISAALHELDPHDKSSIERIRQLQEKLWTSCLRMETALKTLAQINREANEWARRDHIGDVNIHHPAIRLEILNSEQHLRNMKKHGLMPRAHETTSEPQQVFQSESESTVPVQAEMNDELPTVTAQVIHIQEIQPTHLTRDEEQILAHINNLIKEIQLNQDAPEQDTSETLRLVHDLQRNYQELKTYDRQKRIKRHRAKLADALH